MVNAKISIVVPCYRCEKTVEKTIRSIQAQTMRDWELICVNDGSPDGTGSLLDRFAKEEPRMRVIHQENGGVSSARNAGLAAAKGEWVAFVDADDWMLFDALQKLLDLTVEDADIVCCAFSMRYIDEGNREEMVVCKDGDIQTVTESLIRGDSGLNNMFAKLYRRSMLMSHGITVPVGVKIGEDVLFNLEAFAAARHWVMSEDMIYVYEFGGDSAMTRARDRIFEKSLLMVDGIDRFLEKQGKKTEYFRAHLDIYIRLLRADRGRKKAALSFTYAMIGRIVRGVRFGELTPKEKLYYLALRLVPALSYFLP